LCCKGCKQVNQPMKAAVVKDSAHCLRVYFLSIAHRGLKFKPKILNIDIIGKLII